MDLLVAKRGSRSTAAVVQEIILPKAKHLATLEVVEIIRVENAMLVARKRRKN